MANLSDKKQPEPLSPKQKAATWLLIVLLAAILLAGGLLVAELLTVQPAHALPNAKDWLKKQIEERAKSGGTAASALSPQTIADGLKEALTVGTRRAVEKVSRPDGYLANPAIHIPLPDNMAKVSKTLRKVGAGKQVDELEEKMNRAAEQAAPKAVDIFVGAVKRMTLNDVMGIYNGGPHAATDYFNRATRPELRQAFEPVVAGVVGQSGLARAYEKVMTQYNRLPFVKKEEPKLEGYVVDKALDGLFYTLAEEEAKIRQDPAARTTDLLKKVFQ